MTQGQQEFATPQEALAHYGVKGMHWGVRKKEEVGGYRAKTEAVSVEPGIHASTKNAAIKVSNLINERYGYSIDNVKVLGPGHPEYPGTVAYVESNHNNGGRNSGTIFIQSQNLTAGLKETEKIGWMAEGCGNPQGLLTHETAHSMFHADQTTKAGFLGPKVVGGNINARNKALKAAVKAANQDGTSIWTTSDYARYAGNREELEAEMFSQYHWATNPPRFVEVWGKTLHQELGLDPTPFKEVK